VYLHRYPADDFPAPADDLHSTGGLSYRYRRTTCRQRRMTCRSADDLPAPPSVPHCALFRTASPSHHAAVLWERSDGDFQRFGDTIHHVRAHTVQQDGLVRDVLTDDFFKEKRWCSSPFRPCPGVSRSVPARLSPARFHRAAEPPEVPRRGLVAGTAVTHRRCSGAWCQAQEVPTKSAPWRTAPKRRLSARALGLELDALAFGMGIPARISTTPPRPTTRPQGLEHRSAVRGGAQQPPVDPAKRL